MLSTLQHLCEKGIIRQLDWQFARFIYSIETQHAEQVAFIAGIVSQQLSQGHVCIRPGALNLPDKLALYGELAQQLDSEMSHLNWDTILTSASVVGSEADNVNQPLIYDGERLYLQRYWYYEKCLSQKLIKLAEPIPLSDSECQPLTETLNNLFPDSGEGAGEVDWQKVAVAVALSRRLAVISGGPGTGKTTTVVKLLSALVEQGVQQGQLPDIKLVAPTGKAAARLTESIGSAVEALSVSQEIKAHIPIQASTIHRLLGAIPNRAEFRHHSLNPLHLDVLVVDEASMVDLPLMAKLLEALPQEVKLILLGDKDQLSSVEAGAVLGDICSFIDYGYSEAQAALLSRLTATDSSHFSSLVNPSSTNSRSANRISDSLCLLKKSYRFDQDSGIGTLAAAINSANMGDVVTILDKKQQDVTYHELTSKNYHGMIDFVATQYEKYLDCIANSMSCDAEQINKVALKALGLFSECRLLCAVREGDFGLSGLNRAIENALNRKQKIPLSDDIWYSGRPIMITRNDHALGLYNGDIGIAIPVSEQGGIKVFFELPDGTIKSVLPSRLPEHDTAYAMTVHKSQGSEFPTTVLVIPDRISPVVTKELIYTAVTRAKQQLHIYADKQILLSGVKTKTERLSGLRDRLF